VDRARRALSGSLKRLGRDRIDLYMLHEPDYSLLDTDEWLRWLEDERQHVAWFGIALDTARLAPFLRNESRLASIIQTFDSIAGHEADVILKTGRPLQVTYGYVSSFEGRRSEDVGAVLASALQRNATGSIIVSTAKAERLSQYRNAVELADRQISGA
jgi:aryl-alcohol dehydrogenase-like predicted oxidoreductase